MEHSQIIKETDWYSISRYCNSINKIALVFSDFLAMAISSCLSIGLGNFRDSDSYPIGGGFESSTELTRSLFLSGLAFAAILWFWGKLRHYSYRKPFWSELSEILQALSVVALLDLAALAFSKQDFPRLEWLFLWACILVLVPTLRSLTKYILIKCGCWEIPCVIIGTKENALEAYEAITSEYLLGMRVQAFIAPDENSLQDTPVGGVPVLSSFDYWKHCLKKSKVYIALEVSERELRDDWLRKLSSFGANNISVVPSLRGIPLYGTDMSHFFSHDVMVLRLRNNLARLLSRIIKRTFDIVVSFLLLVIFSPLFAYISLMVRKDGGSITYGHERVGYQGKKFKCLKFRSMVVNSKEVLEDLLKNDPQAREEWNKDFKLKDDPRVTRIGSFLRKTSLDELPQLWNVLKGDMSLVGPRPIVEEELARYQEDVEYYLMVKPGMTGVWQVSGRSDADYTSRVYFDSWYVKNWSLWYDIAILCKTFKVVINKDGAY